MTAAVATPVHVRPTVRRTSPSLPTAIWLEVRKSISTRSGLALVVSGASPSDVGAIAAAGGHVLSELRPLQRGLEDVFFSLTAA